MLKNPGLPEVAPVETATLADFMIDFGVGVTSVATYEVKKIDSDYFDETWLERRF